MAQDVRLKISPPWVTYINKLVAMFDGDPQIACNVNTFAGNPSIVLSCNNGDKVTALKQLLPTEVKFGNITLTVGIDGPETNRAFPTPKELFDTAFKGNPAYVMSISPVDDGYWFVDITYVIFKNCVVQFFNDNISDAHGVISTLYQDIAAELFADYLENCKRGVHFNTDVEDGIALKADVQKKLGKPLGEWP